MRNGLILSLSFPYFCQLFMDRDIRSKSSLKIFKLKIDYRSKENRDVRDIITA